MARFVVIDQVQGRKLTPVSYCSEAHMTHVLSRLGYEGGEYIARDPLNRAEIKALDAQRVALKAEGRYLPGWQSYE